MIYFKDGGEKSHLRRPPFRNGASMYDVRNFFTSTSPNVDIHFGLTAISGKFHKINDTYSHGWSLVSPY